MTIQGESFTAPRSQFDLELGLLSVWSFWACFPVSVWVSFGFFSFFPPPGSLIVQAKFPLGVNEYAWYPMMVWHLIQGVFPTFVQCSWNRTSYALLDKCHGQVMDLPTIRPLSQGHLVIILYFTHSSTNCVCDMFTQCRQEKQKTPTSD